MRLLAAGCSAVRGVAPWERVFVLACLVLCISFLPFGRRSGGGPWKPISVDSGYLFRAHRAADFFSVYEAGARVLRGIDPYTVNAIDAEHPPLRAPYTATYRYLPLTSVVLAAPLNILPPWWSYRAWVLLSFGLLVANFLLCSARRPRAIPGLALVWFAWFPLQVEWYMGQFSVLMATVMLWSADALMEGRHRVAAVSWIGSVLVKTYTLAWVPALWFWGYRRAVVAAVVLAVGFSAAWFAAYPESRAFFMQRGLDNRVISGLRQPYAGATGFQELIRAGVWVAKGRPFSSGLAPNESPPPASGDPAFWLVAAMVVGYGVLCAAMLWRSRSAPCARTLGVLWMIWFVAYADCWEHHSVLFQALLGFWLSRGVLSPGQAIAGWAFAGSPSLWIPFAKAMEGGPGAMQQLAGLAYFLHRPVGYALGLWFGLRSRSAGR